MVPRVIIDDTHTVMLCNYFDPRSRSYCSRLKANCHTHQEHAKVSIDKFYYLQCSNERFSKKKEKQINSRPKYIMWVSTQRYTYRIL